MTSPIDTPTNRTWLRYFMGPIIAAAIAAALVVAFGPVTSGRIQKGTGGIAPYITDSDFDNSTTGTIKRPNAATTEDFTLKGSNSLTGGVAAGGVILYGGDATAGVTSGGGIYLRGGAAYPSATYEQIYLQSGVYIGGSQTLNNFLRMDSDASLADISTTGNGRLRYNQAAGKFQYSVNGGAWTSFTTGTVTNVTATSPLTSSGGATPDISSSMAQNKLIGRGSASGTGVFQEIALGTNLALSGTTLNATDTDTGITQLTGDVTAGPGNGSQAATIPNNTVTYAKMQDVSAASKLLGRGDSGSGDPQEIALGTGLSMSGTTLNATAGTVTYNDPLAVQNLGWSVTVGSSAITIAMKQIDGSTNPSTGSASVNIGFRSATLTSGAVNVRSVTSSLSMTVSNGSSLGFASATATQRVYLGAIDNAGTVELCCWTSLSGTNLRRFNDGDIVTTTAEGGAGAADSAQTIYSTTARTSVPLRVLGYIEIQAAASFAWTNSPTVVRVVQPNMPMTGDIVQKVETVTGAMNTGSNTVPFDDTTPLGTEGNEYQTRAITPTSAINILYVENQGHYASSATGNFVQFIRQDSGDGLASTPMRVDAADQHFSIITTYSKISGTTSSTTFKSRAGQNNAATTTFNGRSGAAEYNGTIASYLRVTEIFQ